MPAGRQLIYPNPADVGPWSLRFLAGCIPPARLHFPPIKSSWTEETTVCRCSWFWWKKFFPRIFELSFFLLKLLLCYFYPLSARNKAFGLSSVRGKVIFFYAAPSWMKVIKGSSTNGRSNEKNCYCKRAALRRNGGSDVKRQDKFILQLSAKGWISWFMSFPLPGSAEKCQTINNWVILKELLGWNVAVL